MASVPIVAHAPAVDAITLKPERGPIRGGSGLFRRGSPHGDDVSSRHTHPAQAPHPAITPLGVPSADCDAAQALTSPGATQRFGPRPPILEVESRRSLHPTFLEPNVPVEGRGERTQALPVRGSREKLMKELASPTRETSESGQGFMQVDPAGRDSIGLRVIDEDPVDRGDLRSGHGHTFIEGLLYSVPALSILVGPRAKAFEIYLHAGLHSRANPRSSKGSCIAV